MEKSIKHLPLLLVGAVFLNVLVIAHLTMSYSEPNLSFVLFTLYLSVAIIGSSAYLFLKTEGLTPYPERSIVRQTKDKNKDILRNKVSVFYELIDRTEKQLKLAGIEVSEKFSTFSDSGHQSSSLGEKEKQSRHHASTPTNSFESVAPLQDLALRLSNRLTKLLTVSRSNANFSANNQLDWKKNKLTGQLGRVRQNQDRTMGLVKQMFATHDSMMRLLGANLQSDLISDNKVNRVSKHLETIIGKGQSGYHNQDQLIAEISHSLDSQTTLANQLGSLVQRVDKHSFSIETVLKDLANITDFSRELDLKLDQSLVDVSCKDLHDEIKGKVAAVKSTYTQLKIALSDIMQELDLATRSLSQSTDKCDNAFRLAQQCSSTYRDTISATKHSRGELNLLASELEILKKRLEETHSLGEDTQTSFTKLEPMLEVSTQANGQIITDANALAAHCDKLSQLLSKQYYELSHCEKMSHDASKLILNINHEVKDHCDTIVRAAALESPLFKELTTTAKNDFLSLTEKSRDCVVLLEEYLEEKHTKNSPGVRLIEKHLNIGQQSTDSTCTKDVLFQRRQE